MQLIIPLETKVEGVRRGVLSLVAEYRSPAEMRFADGLFARLEIPDLRYDSNWVHSDDVQGVPRHYAPKVQMLVDLQQIASEILPPQPIKKDVARRLRGLSVITAVGEKPIS